MVLSYFPYAQIDDVRRVYAVSSLASETEADNLILLETYDPSLLGKIHNAETGEFEDAPPQPYVPDAVSSRQGQLALLEAGFLEAAETKIAAIEDDVQRRRAQIEFGATMWERSNPFLQQMWSELGGTPEQLDDLFVVASQL